MIAIIYKGIEHTIAVVEKTGENLRAFLRNEDNSFKSEGEPSDGETDKIFTWSAEKTANFPECNLTLEIWQNDKSMLASMERYAIVKNSTANSNG